MGNGALNDHFLAFGTVFHISINIKTDIYARDLHSHNVLFYNMPNCPKMLFGHTTCSFTR